MTAPSDGCPGVRGWAKTLPRALKPVDVYRTLIKIAVVLVLLALVWRVLLSGDESPDEAPE